MPVVGEHPRVRLTAAGTVPVDPRPQPWTCLVRVLRKSFMTEQRRSSRSKILEGALDLIRNNQSVSLDSAAAAAGLTKPGLMYYYPSKAALMRAIVDHLLDFYEGRVAKTVPSPDEASPEERLIAYARWMMDGSDRADLVVFSDPRLTEELAARWSARMRPWVEVPADLPAERRARLLTLRAAAEGVWFANASGIHPYNAEETEGVLQSLLTLVEKPVS